MKKGIKYLFAALFMVLIVSGASAAEKKNKSEIKTVDNYIAVFDFEVTTSDKGIARPLTESVRREIVLSGKYKVIDRGNMEKILGEQKLQMSGCVTGECIVEAGQLLGVGKLISGTVSLVGKTYYLTLSLISVRTGEIENVAEDSCRCEVDELLGSTKRLTKILLGEKVVQPSATAPKQELSPDQKDQTEGINKKSRYFQSMTLPGGHKYEGDIVNGKRNGQGTLTFPSGDKYVGAFADDKFNGQGTFVYANGDKYVGAFVDGERNGHGTFAFSNGVNYVGAWVDDKYNGQGTQTLPNGEKYVGAFVNNKRNGQGTFTFSGGEKYVGDFMDDKYNGQAILTFPNGDKYVGAFADNKRNGQGTFTFSDGRVLKGRWINDVFAP